jgi:serine/threonine protein kinase
MAENPELARKSIGRYDIERVLGEGAMGVVYEAKDSRLGRKVAVKTILKSALDSDSAREYSMRFKREAQAVARLNHANIVQVFDFAEEGDLAYIVMELVRGRELKTFFEAKERFELKEVVHIMGELCEALHFAHEASIIHRDIKPANVMIDSQGRVKLTDFGVARVQDTERTVSEKTQAGAVLGTPAYMSPEQINGETLDRRSDIFSAGVILYEFLTGEKPFVGSGVWAIAKKILQEEPAAPSTRNPKVPALFDAVVAKALAKKAANRYQTARELGVALMRALEGLPQVEDVEKTVKLRFDPALLAEANRVEDIGDPTIMRTVPVPPPARTEAVELEFWRSIKDGTDPNDFELYIQQFPSGIYTALAKRKISRLRGVATEDSSGKAPTADQEKREIEEAARREAEAKVHLEKEKAEMEALLARREAEFLAREEALKKREAEVTAIPKKSSPLIPALVAFTVAAIGVGAWQMLKAPDQQLEQRVAELTRLLEESKKREAELKQSREREAQLGKELVALQQEAAALKSGDEAQKREIAERIRQREEDVKRQSELTRQREAEARRQAELTKQREAEIVKMQSDTSKRPDRRAQEPVRTAEPVKPPEPPKPAEPVKVEPEPAKTMVAVATPTPAPPAAPAPTLEGANVESLLQRAIALEGEGKNAEAVKVLRQAARGNQKGTAVGQAAKRLGDLYNKGATGVTRDYQEALKYYDIARTNGVEVPAMKGPR